MTSSICDNKQCNDLYMSVFNAFWVALLDLYETNRIDAFGIGIGQRVGGPFVFGSFSMTDWVLCITEWSFGNMRQQ